MQVSLIRVCWLACLCAMVVCSTSFAAQSRAFIRINQVGYHSQDEKVAIAFSKTPLRGDFVLLDASNRVVYRAPLMSVSAPNWGSSFPHYYELNFSAFKQPGKNILRLEESGTTLERIYHRQLPRAIRKICSSLCVSNAAATTHTWTWSVTRATVAPSMLPFLTAALSMPAVAGTMRATS